MKEYKVVESERKEIERVMNEMAKQGWEVVDVTLWHNFEVKLIITFVRDV